MRHSGCDNTEVVARLPGLSTRLHRWVTEEVWNFDLALLPHTQRVLLQPVRTLLIALRGFLFEHDCWLRASALTYYTMLSLVPMLAFALAFLKGLGVPTKIEPWLIGQLAAGSEDTVRRIIEFINNVKVGTLGVISLCVMVITTFLQLGNIEHALNTIWGVDKGRPLLRKLSDYVSMMVLAPVLLTIVLSAGNQPLFSSLLAQRLISYAMTPLLIILPSVLLWLAFSFGYYYMPNTKVSVLPALAGGLVGSLLWQLTKWGYITFQVGMARYEAIYGAIAQIPVLMVWLQLHWMVTLLGAELTFAFQYVLTYPSGRFAPEIRDIKTSPYVKEWLVNALYLSLVQCFASGQTPWSAVAFAQQQGMPPRLIRDLAGILVRAKLLVEAADAPGHYVPGRDPTTITPWHVLHALRHDGDETTAHLTPQHGSPATLLMGQIEGASQRAVGTRSICAWLDYDDSQNAQ